MSTRSIIARLQEDGKTYDVRYCHSDGYPEYTGAMLQTHYTDPAKVDALFALGNLSILCAELGEQHDFDWHMNTPVEEWSKQPMTKWTRAYHRDRGEELELATTKQLRKYAEDSWGEYVYVWQPETRSWKGYSVGSKKLTLVSIPTDSSYV